jgi:prevent-host-death family protein
MKNTEIAISYFKAHCLEIIDKLQSNHKAIVITKRGAPVAKIILFDDAEKPSLFGSMKHKAKIKSDIVKPINEKWSAEND